MGAIGSREALERPRERGRRPDARRDLAAYLAGEYRHEQPWRLNTRTPDGTGQQLADRMVSRLEIANTLRMLPYRERCCVELHCLEDKSAAAVCRLLRISASTFHKIGRMNAKKGSAMLRPEPIATKRCPRPTGPEVPAITHSSTIVSLDAEFWMIVDRPRAPKVAALSAADPRPQPDQHHDGHLQPRDARLSQDAVERVAAVLEAGA